jgi:hypothetical protein
MKKRRDVLLIDGRLMALEVYYEERLDLRLNASYPLVAPNKYPTKISLPFSTRASRITIIAKLPHCYFDGEPVLKITTFIYHVEHVLT